MTTISVDTSRYEQKTGKKPVGRAFWTFRICSETVTIADKFLHSEAPTTYAKALERAKGIAALRRCSRIILEPPPG
jgi:hypothetical protein